MSRTCLALSLTPLLWPPNATTAAVVIMALPAPLDISDEFFGRFDPIDIDDNGTTDFTFVSVFSGVGFQTPGPNRAVIRLDPPPNIGGPPVPLNPGYLIGASLAPSSLGDLYWDDSDLTIVQVLSTGSGSAFPETGLRALIGLEFQSSLGTHYGYFDVFAGKGYAGITLYGWAYETQPGVPIQAAFVPEPSTAAYLGVGTALILKRNGQTRKQNKALLPTPRGWLVSTLHLIRKCLGFGGAHPRP
jgi:hypothetical protein